MVRDVGNKSPYIFTEAELDVLNQTFARYNLLNPVDVFSYVSTFQLGPEIRLNQFPSDMPKRALRQSPVGVVLEAEIVTML